MSIHVQSRERAIGAQCRFIQGMSTCPFLSSWQWWWCLSAHYSFWLYLFLLCSLTRDQTLLKVWAEIPIPFFPLSSCQVVRKTLISETCFFSIPASDRAPTCHRETIQHKRINSFKSNISPCALSTGARRVPQHERETQLERKLRMPVSGSLKPKAIYLQW